MKLGALLREYGISSENIRFTHGRTKGYRRDSFDDAWHRYTPELDTDSHKQGHSEPETMLSLVTPAVG